MQGLLSIHEALQLGCRVVVLDSLLVLGLLLCSLLISLRDGLVHLHLHLGGLNTRLLDRQVITVLSQLYKCDIHITGGGQVSRHDRNAVRQYILRIAVVQRVFVIVAAVLVDSVEVGVQLGTELLTNIGSGPGLHSELEVDSLFIIIDLNGFGRCQKRSHC